MSKHYLLQEIWVHSKKYEVIFTFFYIHYNQNIFFHIIFLDIIIYNILRTKRRKILKFWRFPFQPEINHHQKCYIRCTRLQNFFSFKKKLKKSSSDIQGIFFQNYFQNKTIHILMKKKKLNERNNQQGFIQKTCRSTSCLFFLLLKLLCSSAMFLYLTRQTSIVYRCDLSNIVRPIFFINWREFLKG